MSRVSHGFVSGVSCMTPMLRRGRIGRQAPVERCLARCGGAFAPRAFIFRRA